MTARAETSHSELELAASGPAPQSGPPSRRGVRRPPINAVIAATATLAMLAYFNYQLPDVFLTSGTLRDVLNQAVVPLILASGLTLVLSAGEFDLTNTATVGLGTALIATLISEHGFGVWAAFAAAILAAIVIGLVTGYLVTSSNAHSFIITLAMASAILGVELTLSDNTTIFENIPASIHEVAANKIQGFTHAVWVAAIIVAFTSVLLHMTRFGRHAQSIGGNADAAYLAGVPVRRVVMACYLLLSIYAAVVAIIVFSRSGVYSPNPAGGFLLSTYAAVFLGAAMAGKKLQFSMLGTVFGVLVLITFSTGLTQMSQPAQVVNLVQGLILTVAVVAASRIKK